MSTLDFSGELVKKELYPETIILIDDEIIVQYEDGYRINLMTGQQNAQSSIYKLNTVDNSFLLGTTKISSDFEVAQLNTVLMEDEQTAVYTCELATSPEGDVKNSRVYFMSGNQAISFVQLKDQTVKVPNKKFQALNSQNVYQMIQDDKKIEIIKLSLKTDIEEVSEHMKGAAYAKFLDNNSTPEISINAVSPSTARSNAINMFQYKWTYVKSRHGNKPNSGVSQPRFLRNVTTSLSVTGIPYCWGGSQGHNATYKTPDNYTFASAMANNKYAGNITSSVGTVKGTAGMDCSGYVSVAYRLGQKYGTSTLVGSGKPFKYVTDGPREMDILNRAGKHVVMHADTTLSGGTIYYLIYEETTTDFESRTRDKTVGYGCVPSKISSSYKRARLQ